MWFGLMHQSPDEGDDVEREMVIVVAYGAHRLFRIGTAPTELPSLLHTLRLAAAQGEDFRPPRCGSCAAPIAVPDLDEEPGCASA